MGGGLEVQRGAARATGGRVGLTVGASCRRNWDGQWQEVWTAEVAKALLQR